MELNLHETAHPNKAARATLADLVGLDEHRERLLSELLILLDSRRVTAWAKRHHQGRLGVARRLVGRTPLILLSGEVGCGKTALARAIGTAVGESLDQRIKVYETPSDLRGSGLVGEISARITGAFNAARGRLRGKPGLLILDEADDVATSRGQLQAHHEDRAGLNVLLRQIDLLARDRVPLAVILITNREGVLDPAIRRRVALHLRFERPSAGARRQMFIHLLQGCPYDEAALDALVAASERPETPYSSGDLIERVANHALREALRADKPFSAGTMLEALAVVEPSPLITSSPGSDA